MEFSKPDHLNISSGDISENFEQFKEEVLIYLTATESEKKPLKVQIARLKNLIGTEGLRLYQTITNYRPEEETINNILETLHEYCVPKKNETISIHKFFSRKQIQGECFDNYYTELKRLVKPCDFRDQEDKLLRSQLILGIASPETQERLLRDNLSLDKVLQFCRSVELANKNVKAINKSELNLVQKTGSFKAISKNYDVEESQSTGHKRNEKLFQSTNNQKDVQQNVQCRNCGYSHAHRRCPAFGKQCNKCYKFNHFANKCLSKTFVRALDADDNNCNPEDKVEFFEDISAITQVNTVKSSHWTVQIRINNNPIICKIDSGADVNILSLKTLMSLKLPSNFKIKPTFTKLEAFGGFKLHPCGEIILPVSLDSKLFSLRFIVIDNDKCISIIGLSSSVEMGLINKVPVNTLKEDVDNVDDVTDFVQSNKDVFYNQGTFPEVLSLKLKDGAVAKSSPARRVPHKISERLKTKLDSLESRGIIEKCEAGEWVHNLVIVEKHKTGDLRLCIDPKQLNQYLIRDYCLIPTLDEVTAKLAGKRFFCVFDLKDGFHQIKLDETSSKLCTFSTPFGVYRYLRAPFGLSVLPEYFQKMTQQYFGQLSGVVVYFDDILCAGDTKEELQKVVQSVLDSARKNNIQLNSQKIQYFVDNVKFLGHRFDSSGVRPDEERILAIQNLKSPGNRKELQKVLGTINYLRPFIPNLAEFCVPLNDLLKKNLHWNWSEYHENCFNTLKEAIKKAALLSPFDPNKPIVIQSDASQKSLGCALFQNGKPILYASRSLTDSEIDYAQVEKELLAVVFAFQKFHNFAYGNSSITVQTDHSPLVSILNKHMCKIPNNRLRRLRLKLLTYSFTIKYVPGKHLHVADLLSRQCEPTNPSDDESMLDIIHILNADIAINSNTNKEYVKATNEDDALKEIIRYFKDGWPKSLQSSNHELNHFFTIRNDLTVQEGLVFYEDRLVVPRGMRRYTLQTLHETHLGLKKLKLKANELVYWPGLNSDLTNYISNCFTCAKFQRANKKEPLLSHEIGEVPFYKIGADIAEFDNVNYLIIVDYYSRWIEVEKLKSKSASSVIGTLKPVLARFGIPHYFMSDNVPFNSKEFIEFSHEWKFNLITSSPYYPKSNGLVEKAVGIVKSMLKKCKYEKSDLNLYLLNYRSSPVANLKYSPAQLLQSRILNTKIPALPQALKPKLVQDSTVTDKSYQTKHYNRTALRVPRSFSEGDHVLIKNTIDKTWGKGEVIRIAGPRSYIVKLENGVLVRRNSWFLKPNSMINR